MRDAWIVILAIAALAAGYFLQDFDLFNDKTPDLVMQSDCPLREKTCEVAVPGYGRLSLTVSPVGFKALSVMQIQLDLPQFSPSVSSAEMQFEGLNMDMGYNRVVLDARMLPGSFQPGPCYRPVQQKKCSGDFTYF